MTFGLILGGHKNEIHANAKLAKDENSSTKNDY